MKLYELTEDAWDDAETRRSSPNPLPIADSASLNRAFDMAEELDDKILADFKAKGGRYNGLREIGAVLKQGRKEVGNVLTVPLSKILASEDMVDAQHLDALVNNEETTAPSGVVTLLKVQNKYYIQDGNHRVAAAAGRGEDRIRALVLDVGSI